MSTKYGKNGVSAFFRRGYLLDMLHGCEFMHLLKRQHCFMTSVLINKPCTCTQLYLPILAYCTARMTVSTTLVACFVAHTLLGCTCSFTHAPHKGGGHKGRQWMLSANRPVTHQYCQHSATRCRLQRVASALRWLS